MQNWAGNFNYSAVRIANPRSVDELAAVVTVGGPVRALGTRHSFNDIADSSGLLVTLDEMPRDISIDESERIVWAPAGLRYGDLAEHLQARGWALHNLASLPHISLAGTVATGTHGSGTRNGSLATAVAAIELMTARGELITLARGDDVFDGAVVSLGSLGIVTRLALDIQPAFEINQRVYLDLSLDTVAENLRDVLALGYSTSLFTTWTKATVDQLWVKSLGAEAPAETFGGTAAGQKMHPIAGVDAVNATDQLGVPGPWLDRLPHFKLDFTPSAGEEIQSEFFVPAESGAEALKALAGLAELIAPVLFVSEIRAIAADDLWLSGAYGQDTIAFHFTWHSRPDEVLPVVGAIEQALIPFGVRPHWGKVFTMDSAQIHPLYPHVDRFLALRERMDPDDVFRNVYLDRVLLGTSDAP